ncbi:MAG: hypothetical protein AAFY60_02295, partial [Myxococcota bacterium]
AAPTEGPFYMVNLIRYRELAVYADGRPTELTGREANDLYSPVEFLADIGARAVFTGEVGGTTFGDEGTWETVAIVEYPCPLALFAMSAHPEFQSRSTHKDAGLEASLVIVTHSQPIDSAEPTDSLYPPSDTDPSFELVQLVRLRDDAQYDAEANEANRTGAEAMALYDAGVADAERRLGVFPKARLDVDGVFIGDGRVWNEVRIDFVPSSAAYDAFVADPEVVGVAYHRDAALDEGYGLITDPLVSAIPNGSDDEASITPPPVAADGTGTLCQSDAACPGDGVDLCISEGNGGGFCTREGCDAGGCAAPYKCCHDCSPTASALLPFEGSACLPDSFVQQLTIAPVSCSCD